MNQIIFLFTFLFEVLTGAFYFSVKYRTVLSRSMTALFFVAVGSVQYGVSFLNIGYLNLALFIVCWFLVGKFVYGLRIWSAVFHAGVLAALMLSTEYVATFLLKLFVDIDMNNIPHGNTLHLLILSVSAKIVYFFGVYIASKIALRERRIRFFAPQTVPLLVLPLASFFILVGLDRTVKQFAPDRGMLVLFLIASLLLLYSNLTVFAVHEYTLRLQKKNAELLLQNQKNEIDVEHYMSLIRQKETADIILHDTAKHMAAVRALAVEGDGDRVVSYIDSVYNDIGMNTLRRFSSNKLVDAIVSRYYNKYSELGVDFFCDVRDIDFSFLADAEITALLDNLLSNAFAAAAATQKKKSVDLSVRRQNVHFIVVSVVNTCGAIPEKRNGRFVSAKKGDQHGVGLASVNAVVKKHGGSLRTDFHEDTMIFEAVAVLDDTV